MKNRPICVISLAGVLLVASCGAKAEQQQKDASSTTPATKLEAFSAKTGVVLIRGYSTVGSLNGLGSVTIDAREFRDAGSPKLRVTGLSIEVKESGRLERESTSFVDYEEIDSLIQGIDCISQLNRNVTALKNFEAEYKTKGDFSVTTFNSPRGIEVAVSSGRFSKASAYLKIDDLANSEA